LLFIGSQDGRVLILRNTMKRHEPVVAPWDQVEKRP
jgi:hypothetical protein